MTTESYRYFDLDRHPGAVVIRFKDEQLTGNTIAEIVKMELMKIVEQYNPGKMVVDLGQARVISSSVIGSLLSVRKKIAAQGGELCLSSVTFPIREVYRTLNLDGTMFQVYDSAEDALEAPTRPHHFRREEYED